MKASKTGLAILMFVLMAIALMVGFGGRPYGKHPQTSESGSGGSVVLRELGGKKPLSPASAAIVSNDANLPKADSFQLSKSPYESANRLKSDLPTVADVPALGKQLDNPFDFGNGPGSPNSSDGSGDRAHSFAATGQVDILEPAPAPRLTVDDRAKRNPEPRGFSPQSGSRLSLPWDRRDPQTQRLSQRQPDENQIRRPGTPRQTPAPSHEPPKEFRRFHRVVDGDSLPTIAGRYLGNPNRYLEIFEANRKVLHQPDLLPLGVRLEIPPTSRATVGAADIRPIAPGDHSAFDNSMNSPGFGGFQPQSTTSPTPTPTHSPIPNEVQQDEWRHVGDKNNVN